MKYFYASVNFHGERKSYSGWGAFRILEQLANDKIIPDSYLEPRSFANQKLEQLKTNKIITLAKL